MKIVRHKTTIFWCEDRECGWISRKLEPSESDGVMHHHQTGHPVAGQTTLTLRYLPNDVKE